MWLPYKILLITQHILSLPLHLIFFLLLALYKLLVILLSKLFQKDFVGPIPAPDCLFIADKIWDKPHSTIIVGVELEDSSHADVTKVFQMAYDFKDENGNRCYRELGYYLVKYMGYGFWKEVPDFKISDRVHTLKIDQSQEKLGSKTSQSEVVTSVVDKIQRQAYEKEQPLWDIYLLPNFNGKSNRSLMLIRFHHLMSDGVSFVKLFYALTGSSQLPDSFTKPKGSMKTWDKVRKNVLVKIGTAFYVWFIGFVDYINALLLEQDKHALHIDEDGKLKLTGNWVSSLGGKFDLAEVKMASKYYECSVVHIVLAGMGKGLERYFEKYHGGKDKMPEGFHFIFPMPIPGHPDMRFVNHWCIAKLYNKMGIEDTTAKLEYLKEATGKCALEALPLISAFTFQYLMGILPAPIADLASKARATSTVVLSNVVGPQDKNRRLGDAKLVDMFFWMPVSQESMALSAGVISCNGSVRICLCADVGCIPDRKRLDELGSMIYEEIQDVCRLAKKNL